MKPTLNLCIGSVEGLDKGSIELDELNRQLLESFTRCLQVDFFRLVLMDLAFLFLSGELFLL